MKGRAEEVQKEKEMSSPSDEIRHVFHEVDLRIQKSRSYHHSGMKIGASNP